MAVAGPVARTLLRASASKSAGKDSSGARTGRGVSDLRIARREAIAGLVVAFALIPESISFAVVAGISPLIGLLTAAVMAVTISIVGGRPAMISGCAGSTALVIAPLSHAHGLSYVVAAVMLGGLIEIVLGIAGIAALMRFVPRSVMVGFVNALAILIFSAQLGNLEHVSWRVYPLVGIGLLVIVGFPRITRAVPGPLVAIALLTILAAGFHLGVPTVADKGGIGHWGLPLPALPAVPHTPQMVRTIFPYAAAFAIVGLLESLMTAQLIDDMTSTNSNKNREAWGQGISNVVTGLLGGMGGCAMIGQAILNVKTGGRGRVSTFTAGLSIFVLVGVLGSIVGKVPMAALVAVMFVVAANTFDWKSIRPSTLRRLPKSETGVMVVTVVGTVVTNDLAVGVIAGVVVACLLFARRTSGLIEIAAVPAEDGDQRSYRIAGQLFFASSARLADHFDYDGDPSRVVLDLGGAAVCDATSVAALDTVVARYAERGKRAELVNLDLHSANLYATLSGRLGVPVPDTAAAAGGPGATPSSMRAAPSELTVERAPNQTAPTRTPAPLTGRWKTPPTAASAQHPATSAEPNVLAPRSV